MFSFTLEQDGDVVLDTTGSDFDTVMAVRTQCASVASEMLCDDDGGDGLQSRVEFNAAAGTPYYVVVHGYGANSRGNITLNFTSR